jgi:hypothetical protein
MYTRNSSKLLWCYDLKLFRMENIDRVVPSLFSPNSELIYLPINYAQSFESVGWRSDATDTLLLGGNGGG